MKLEAVRSRAHSGIEELAVEDRAYLVDLVISIVDVFEDAKLLGYKCLCDNSGECILCEASRAIRKARP
jgi:hypothetical protein